MIPRVLKLGPVTEKHQQAQGHQHEQQLGQQPNSATFRMVMPLMQIN